MGKMVSGEEAAKIIDKKFKEYYPDGELPYVYEADDNGIEGFKVDSEVIKKLSKTPIK